MGGDPEAAWPQPVLVTASDISSRRTPPFVPLDLADSKPSNLLPSMRPQSAR